MDLIKRIDFKNRKKDLDLEIVDLQTFYTSRSKDLLEADYRLNFWVILYISHGHGSHYVDFHRYDYKAGDILFIQVNQVQRFVVNSEAQGYILHINEPFFYKTEAFTGDIFLEFIDRSYGSPMSSFDLSNQATNRILIDLIYHEYHQEVINVDLVGSLFQSFIIALRDHYKEETSIVTSQDYVHFKHYRKLVEKHYKTIKTVEAYAEMMHLSKKTINLACKRVTGLTAKQYIIQRLILEIKRYLSQGDMMNYEIAEALGFFEAANMTKFFKHYEGISPKEFKSRILRS